MSKIKDPSKWPVDSIDFFLEVPSDDEDLQDIAHLLYSHQRAAVMLGSSPNQKNVEFTLRVKGKEETRIHSVSVSVKPNSLLLYFKDLTC